MLMVNSKNPCIGAKPLLRVRILIPKRMNSLEQMKLSSETN